MHSILLPHRRVRVLTIGIAAAVSLYVLLLLLAEPLRYSRSDHAHAATSTGTVVVTLNVASDVSISCSSPVSLGTITRTGDSSQNTCATTGYCGTNSTACTVTTNNPTGYSLGWVIRTGSGKTGQPGTRASTGTGYLNGYTAGDFILPLGTGSTVANTQPHAMTAGAGTLLNDARWAGRLSSTSTTTGGGGKAWGTDGNSDTWLRVATGAVVTIANRTTQTTGGGDTENIGFRAIIHGSAIVPTDTYKATVLITATTN